MLGISPTASDSQSVPSGLAVRKDGRMKQFQLYKFYHRNSIIQYDTVLT
jgi:hypothetical protein